ncbi:glutathione S-transferase-like [Ostrinia nubilalis]|uniref:glutathione S-transferase-like n=1 Tax=Ostrinia nubilalis TaxID=29057 RepID=UPI0030824727
MAKRLHYFNVNGFAEAIRYILHYGGEKFEDVRYEKSQWPIKSVKESLPYGQFPLYEEGDKSLNQSLAIARYLARKADLLPSDLWQQAVLDAIVYNISDFWNKTKAIVFIANDPDADKKAAVKKEIITNVVPFYFKRFEEDLKSNNGHFGGKLTWADFMLVAAIEKANLFLEETIEKDYPNIAALVMKIQYLPGVKEYIAAKTPYEI